MSNKIVRKKKPWEGESVYRFFTIQGEGTIIGFPGPDTAENRKLRDQFMEQIFGDNPDVAVPIEY